MAFPTSAGVESYSGSFIPEIWEGMWNVKYYDTTVLGSISNTKYQGSIKNHGDKVIIRQKPDVTIRTYNINQDLLVERPKAPILELPIDQGEYFNCILDDVDETQSDMGLLTAWTEDATEKMKIIIDDKILGTIYNDIAATNTGILAGRRSGSYNLGSDAAPVQLDKSGVLDYIVDHGCVLDEANVPKTGRFLVIPTWMAGLIKKSDLKDASLTGDGSSVLRNGRIGMIDTFEVFLSNQLPELDAGEYVVYAGHKDGLTFASQMTKMERLRSERTFGTLLRGLQIYGYKVVKDDALTFGVVTKKV